MYQVVAADDDDDDDDEEGDEEEDGDELGDTDDSYKVEVAPSDLKATVVGDWGVGVEEGRELGRWR